MSLNPFLQALVVECHGMLWMGVTTKYEILLCGRRHPMPRASDGPRAIQEPVYQSPIASENMKVGHQRHHVTTPSLFAAYFPAVSPTSRSRDCPCWGPSLRPRWPGTSETFPSNGVPWCPTVAPRWTVSKRVIVGCFRSTVVGQIWQIQVRSKSVEINSKFSSSPALALAKEGVPLGVPVVIPHWRSKGHPLLMCPERCWIPTSTNSIRPVHGLTANRHDAIWRYLEYFRTMWMCFSRLQSIKKAKGSQIVPFECKSAKIKAVSEGLRTTTPYIPIYISRYYVYSSTLEFLTMPSSCLLDLGARCESGRSPMVGQVIL